MVSESNASDWTGQPPDRRKLIAVVHADMVGYSRLIGLDDSRNARTDARLRRDSDRAGAREHGGRIVNTGGDSLLIVFDSVDGAVRCAVTVQQQVPSTMALLPIGQSDSASGSTSAMSFRMAPMCTAMW